MRSHTYFQMESAVGMLLSMSLSVLFLFTLFSQPATADMKGEKHSKGAKMEMDTISSEMQRVLWRELESWYPLAVDKEYGGFFSDINYKWELDGRQDKMIVTQARHVWSTSKAAEYFPNVKMFRTVADHGVEFLKNTMWDRKFGGFFDLVNRRGKPLQENSHIMKTAYGNAFALYGLAAYYKISGDTLALQLAKKTFHWLEQHSYDSSFGGYFQFMSQEGSPYLDGYRGTPPKDQNSTIHLLESFTELYQVWPDRLLRNRLSSLLHIVRDTITTKKGYMMLFFKRDWTPVSFRDANRDVQEKNFDLDHVSFGHDIETAYLLLEASHALGIEHDRRTLSVAKKMVDHTLHNGWDDEHGGIFDRGYYFSGQPYVTIIQKTKEWWAQVEALNSLLMMSQLFPDDENRYYAKFCDQWSYCKKYLIDSQYGGWYWGGVDMVPDNRYFAKGTIWKGTYHTARSMMNCIRRLSQISKR